MRAQRQPLAFYAAFFTGAWLRRMVAYAGVVYGFEVLGGGRWSGFFYLCLVLPYTLSLYAGSVLDAASKKAVLQVTEGVPVVLFAVLALAEHQRWLGTGTGHGWVVAAFIGVYGVIAAFAYPAFLATIPETVAREHVAGTTAVVSILGMLCHACAPLGVGALRAFLSWPSVFVAFAGLAAISWGFLQAVGLSSIPVERSRQSEWSRLRDLWRYVAGLPSLAAVLGCVTLFAGLVVGPLEVLAPLFAETSIGGSPLSAGLFLATGGVGLFIGAIVALKLMGRGHLGAWLCSSAMVGSVMIIAMTWVHHAVAFPLIFCGGFLGGLFSSLSVAGVQERASDALRGRVLGLFTLLLGATPALGGLLAGTLVESIGILAAIRGVFAVVILAFAVLYFTQPSLREVRDGGSACS
jgi:DHA3 family macrolide efflux protein-like MFS transporter